MDNRQALGYMLLACKRLNLDKEQVQELFREMHTEFDFKTEEEAEEMGFKYYYDLVSE